MTRAEELAKLYTLTFTFPPGDLGVFLALKINLAFLDGYKAACDELRSEGDIVVSPGITVHPEHLANIAEWLERGV